MRRGGLQSTAIGRSLFSEARRSLGDLFLVARVKNAIAAATQAAAPRHLTLPQPSLAQGKLPRAHRRGPRRSTSLPA